MGRPDSPLRKKRSQNLDQREIIILYAKKTENELFSTKNKLKNNHRKPTVAIEGDAYVWNHQKQCGHGG